MLATNNDMVCKLVGLLLSWLTYNYARLAIKL